MQGGAGWSQGRVPLLGRMDEGPRGPGWGVGGPGLPREQAMRARVGPYLATTEAGSGRRAEGSPLPHWGCFSRKHGKYS